MTFRFLRLNGGLWFDDLLLSGGVLLLSDLLNVIDEIDKCHKHSLNNVSINRILSKTGKDMPATSRVLEGCLSVTSQ